MEGHVGPDQVPVPVPVPEVHDTDVEEDRWNMEKIAEAHHAPFPDSDPERDTRAVDATLGCCLARCMDLSLERQRKRPRVAVQAQKQEDIGRCCIMGQGQGQDDKLETRLGVGIEGQDRIDTGSGDRVVGMVGYAVDLVDMSLVDPDNDVLSLEQKVEDHTGLVVEA